MAVTDCVVLKEMGLDRLNQAISEAVADGYTPQAGVLVIQGGWYGMVMVQDDTASVTGCKVVSADGFARLNDVIKDGVADGYTPHTRILQAENDNWLVTLVQGSTGGGGGGGGEVSVAWADITGKPATFAPTIGTTAATAKPGDYVPTTDEVNMAMRLNAPLFQADWAEKDTGVIRYIKNRPAVIAAGATQAEARTAIGAGVGNSNLVVGTTASQAKAGNWKPTVADVSDAGAFGRQLMQAADQAAAKALLGIS